MKIPLVLISLILVVLAVHAQPYGKQNQRSAPEASITGKVVDAQSLEQMEYATISLYNKRDSALITGTVSQKDGSFEMITKPGVFFMKIEFISYKQKVIDDIRLVRGTLAFDAGIVKLHLDTRQLNEVEVQAERSTFQTHLDKKIFTVGRDIAGIGGSAADVLDNIPSVAVDIDGNVSLRGSENVRILIDGKPSGMKSTTTLERLSSDMIEKVEIITNPSARYDAEGLAGIINIILKKNRKDGLNGTITLRTGWPHNHGPAVNMNYKTKKVNLFGAFDYRYRTRPVKGYAKTITYFGDTTSTLEQNETFKREGWGANARLGTDWFVNRKTTITVSGDFGKGLRNNIADVDYQNFGSSSELQALNLRETTETEDDFDIETDFHFLRTFSKKGRKLTADFHYEFEKEEELMDAEDFAVDLSNGGTPVSTALQRIANTEQQENYLAQADYVQPFAEKGNFEAGWKSNIRMINTDYQVEDFVDSSETWQALAGVSNRFRYDERIYAAYAIVGNAWKKLSWQVGLRTEYSSVSTLLLETNERNDRERFDPFPSAHFSVDLAHKNSFQLSYSRRIQRPRFWYLNPFFTYVNPLNFRSGNPNLDPEYTHSTEIAHIKRWKKFSLTSSIYYRYRTGVIARISRVDSSGVTTSRPENLLTADDFGAELIISYEPFEWWRMFGSANFFRSMVDGANLGDDFNSDFYSLSGRLNSKWKFWKDAEIQVVARYRGPAEIAQGNRKAMYFADISCSKDVMKKNATISLKLSDIFGTRKRRSESFGEHFYVESERQWHPRRFIATFTYRINQQKNRERPRGGFEEGEMGI